MKNSKVWLALAACTASFLLGASNIPTFALSRQESQPQTPNGTYLAQARTYRVQLGDSLSGIAYKNKISLQQLLAYNPSLRSNPHLIRVGQVIYVSKAPTPTTPVRRTSTTRRQSVQAFNLPNKRGGSNANRIGARRGPAEQACFTNPTDNIRVLLPDTNFGYTLQDYPTFFWYMPQLKFQAQRLELKIKPVGATSFQTYRFKSDNQQQGIMSVTLPENLGPLVEGREYTWEVRVYCTSQMFLTATGNIERLSTNNPELSQKLEEAEMEDYPAILAKAGVWYDAISILAGLRNDNRNDPSLTEDWVNIMEMIKFNDISSVPLLAVHGVSSSSDISSPEN